MKDSESSPEIFSMVWSKNNKCARKSIGIYSQRFACDHAYGCGRMVIIWSIAEKPEKTKKVVGLIYSQNVVLPHFSA